MHAKDKIEINIKTYEYIPYEKLRDFFTVRRCSFNQSSDLFKSMMSFSFDKLLVEDSCSHFQKMVESLCASGGFDFFIFSFQVFPTKYPSPLAEKNQNTKRKGKTMYFIVVKVSFSLVLHCYLMCFCFHWFLQTLT